MQLVQLAARIAADVVRKRVAGVIGKIAGKTARLDEAEQVAVAGDFAAQAKQIFLDESGLAGRDRKRGRIADACDHGRVVT